MEQTSFHQENFRRRTRYTAVFLILAAVLFDYIGREFGGKTSSFLRACYYLPQVLPVGVAGILWNWILNSLSGASYRILAGLFGMDKTPDCLGDPDLAI